MCYSRLEFKEWPPLLAYVRRSQADDHRQVPRSPTKLSMSRNRALQAVGVCACVCECVSLTQNKTRQLKSPSRFLYNPHASPLCMRCIQAVCVNYREIPSSSTNLMPAEQDATHLLKIVSFRHDAQAQHRPWHLQIVLPSTRPRLTNVAAWHLVTRGRNAARVVNKLRVTEAHLSRPSSYDIALLTLAPCQQLSNAVSPAAGPRLLSDIDTRKGLGFSQQSKSRQTTPVSPKPCHRAPAHKVRHSKYGAISTPKNLKKRYTRYRLLKPRGLAGPQTKIQSHQGTRPSRGGQEGLDLSRLLYRIPPLGHLALVWVLPLANRDPIFNICILLLHIIEPSHPDRISLKDPPPRLRQ